MRNNPTLQKSLDFIAWLDEFNYQHSSFEEPPGKITKRDISLCEKDSSFFNNVPRPFPIGYNTRILKKY